jgi:hypothetical protein
MKSRILCVFKLKVKPVHARAHQRRTEQRALLFSIVANHMPTVVYIGTLYVKPFTVG